MVLLTNRVHPTRENNRIQAIRPAFHDAVMEEFDRRCRAGSATPPYVRFHLSEVSTRS